ncbi:MAG: SANT/Myb domain-containing protein [Puniceicoccales bacterium]|jgi:hypothetical protein|nr:SANT/Myb domain-containing protein [Puniceicoccales bacterium]
MNKSHKKILTLGFGCFISVLGYLTAPYSFGAHPPPPNYGPFGAYPPPLNYGPFVIANQLTASKPKNQFTSEEDVQLRNLVNLYGANDWRQIAFFMSGRNARQCRDR